MIQHFVLALQNPLSRLFLKISGACLSSIR